MQQRHYLGTGAGLQGSLVVISFTSTAESADERILKIDQDLAKLWARVESCSLVFDSRGTYALQNMFLAHMCMCA